MRHTDDGHQDMMCIIEALESWMSAVFFAKLGAPTSFLHFRLDDGVDISSV